MQTVYLHGTSISLDPARILGTGGEAEVYDLGNGSVAKVWKAPEHSDFERSEADKKAAEARIAVHQTKMRAFPKQLPAELVAPTALLTDQSGKTIVGYVMNKVRDAFPLHAYSDPGFRRRGTSLSDVVLFFERLAATLRQLHAARFILGDFNDFNVLVTPDGQPRIIDADSAQFGSYRCTVFTERFVDPLLCRREASSPELVRPYTEGADWFAYNALLFQSIFCIGPFGGVFRPSDAGRRIPHAARPMHRVSVFDPDVKLPKQTPPFSILPDEWIHHFRSVFEGTEREVVTPEILRRLCFSICPNCRLEHATRTCPACERREPRPQVRSLGDLAIETLFTTNGTILDASTENGGALRVVHHEGGAYCREDGAALFHGPLHAAIHARARSGETLLARGNELLRITRAGVLRQSVDSVRGVPSFACHANELFWCEGGRLVKAEPSSLDPEAIRRVGDVLEGQTRVWVGPSFGIGFYRVGELVRGFTFDVRRGGLRDDLRFPKIVGDVVDAAAALDGQYAWLFLAINEGPRVRHRCIVFSRDGACIATHDAERGDDSWLGRIGGALATAGVLLVPTDEGIVRVVCERGALRVTREFRETEPFVDASCRLLASNRGLLVVHPTKILLLHIQPN